MRPPDHSPHPARLILARCHPFSSCSLYIRFLIPPRVLIRWWHTIGEYDQDVLAQASGLGAAGARMKRARKTLFAPARKIKKMVNDDRPTAKGVSPESMFVVNRAANSEIRESSILSERIRSMFAREFSLLEDVLRSHDEDGTWHEIWETAAQDAFDETAQLRQLGWNEQCGKAAHESIKEKASLAVTPEAMHRVFLKSNPLEVDGRRGKVKQIPVSVDAVSKAAREFVTSGDSEMLLDLETLPFDRVNELVREALDVDRQERRAVIEDLQRRAEALGDAPTQILITGLRGDASKANGVYSAHGLRAFWGRPLYVQETDARVVSSINYLYYDMRHDSCEDGEATWVEGTWILGPTFNSERCTAYLREREESSIFPATTESLADSETPAAYCWQVFDVVTHSWMAAPGTHAPAFEVEVLSGQNSYTMQDYIQMRQEHAHTMLQKLEEMLADGSSFSKELDITLAGYKAKDSTVARSGFLAWRETFYRDEIRKAQTALRKKILNKSSQNMLQLSADPEESREQVDDVINAYIAEVVRAHKKQRSAKFRFGMRMSRPTLSRAFFTWKFAVRQSTGAIKSSGLFDEPALPWNVRHPRSSFTQGWETVQAIILVYVAFSVIFRVAFNADATGKMALFELGIDIYFAIDVVLNFHTAYYDKSGDLVGVRPQHLRTSRLFNALTFYSGADLQKLARKYAGGWMVIDLVSVVPWPWIFSLFARSPDSADSGQDAKALKVLRLLRLTKILRLARAMHIYKKYEEMLGPLFSAVLLIGVVILAIHTITCIWYLLHASRVQTGLMNGCVELLLLILGCLL